MKEGQVYASREGFLAMSLSVFALGVDIPCLKAYDDHRNVIHNVAEAESTVQRVFVERLFLFRSTHTYTQLRSTINN